MKNMKRLVGAAFLGVGLVFSAGTVHALSLSHPVFAGLEISDITRTGDVRIQVGDTSSYAFAYVTNDSDADSGSGARSASAEVPYAIGIARISNNLGAMAELTGAGAELSSNNEASASAGALVGIDLSLSGDGSVTLYAQYFLFQELLTEYVGEYADAYSEAGLYFEDSLVMASLDNSVSHGGFGSWQDGGNLELTIPVSGQRSGTLGWYVYNTSYASAAVPVPEPASLVLLGGGLLGLVWLRGRFMK